jgi:hypothetical protein
MHWSWASIPAALVPLGHWAGPRRHRRSAVAVIPQFRGITARSLPFERAITNNGLLLEGRAV